ncbi:MAG: hypothetical protein NT137_00060 [Methanomassiliicoccales archaeon]|nr:hypothetical protein [Methanomassiliicoccales archaeon]
MTHEVSGDVVEVLKAMEKELMDHRYLLQEVIICQNMSDGRAIAIFVSGIGTAMSGLG